MSFLDFFLTCLDIRKVQALEKLLSEIGIGKLLPVMLELFTLFFQLLKSVYSFGETDDNILTPVIQWAETCTLLSRHETD